VNATLHDIVRPAQVDFITIRGRYGPLLELVRALIGVVPHCDPVLEIWPTAFRGYNVMVPNFLNLPFFMWGLGAPKAPVALAMLAASRSADCRYCTAHTCSFAVRRGVERSKIESEPGAIHSEAERAAMAVGEALGAVPTTLTEGHREALRRHLRPADEEWVVLAVAMMGFLNKFMDAMGIDLEAQALDEAAPLLHRGTRGRGWTAGRHRISPASDAAPPAGDSVAFHLRLTRLFPAAIALDRRWTRGVPSRWPDVGRFLSERAGHDFPVLRHLSHGRAVRAIATMLRDQWVAADSVVGLGEKARAGVVFAATLADRGLARDMRALWSHGEGGALSAAESLGDAPFDADDGAAVDRVARTDGPTMLLAKAASYSPARVTPQVLAHVSAMPPAAIVEMVAWLSVLQLLHRLNVYFEPATAP
jgi:hypothetical protein